MQRAVTVFALNQLRAYQKTQPQTDSPPFAVPPPNSVQSAPQTAQAGGVNALVVVETGFATVFNPVASDHTPGKTYAACYSLQHSLDRTFTGLVCDGCGGERMSSLVCKTFVEAATVHMAHVQGQTRDTYYRFFHDFYAHLVRTLAEQRNTAGEDAVAALAICTRHAVCICRIGSTCMANAFETRGPAQINNEPPPSLLTPALTDDPNAPAFLFYYPLRYDPNKTFHGRRFLVLCNAAAGDGFGGIAEIGRFVESPLRFIASTERLKHTTYGRRLQQAASSGWHAVVAFLKDDLKGLRANKDNSDAHWHDCMTAAQWIVQTFPLELPFRLGAMARLAACFAILMGCQKRIAIVIRQIGGGPASTVKGLYAAAASPAAHDMVLPNPYPNTSYVYGPYTSSLHEQTRDDYVTALSAAAKSLDVFRPHLGFNAGGANMV